jgi:2'-5' RNA ligase
MASSTKISLDQQQRQQLTPIRFHKLFFAIVPPHHILKELNALQVYLQQDYKGRYTEFANLHCTLVYVGPVEESMLTLIKNILLSTPIESFDTNIISITPAQSTHTKMLWANLEKDTIGQAIEVIEKALIGQAQLKIETKHEKKPHITLARLSKETTIDNFETIPLNLSWHVDTIIAFESLQNAFGEISYNSLFTINLR